ncbi:hypothetical protein UFOVP4_13 [uncultured Caudovirales phage]|uniref:Phage major capsid protein n=1 Tax=uncultured Caudovirales phage TaxID=2100421 RepID=A0A6J5KG57_9CAUD|nr:hypothetical protein UFOVP4_13 [uncultured Caudovirales phage]CAB4241330.1 hypothetical protein UFOVP64_46 [uncultured Caudovirales phage]CAB5078961.1 hypothetical protein UFOVP145_2 [uncultured Caudovirales phage]
MAFTAQELDNIASAALDYYIKGPAMAQSIQARPLYDAMRKVQKTFPGGKSDIRRNIKGEYSSAFQGYSHDDSVGYVNPANLKQVNFPWKELHAGIAMTLTELKSDGISVVDSLNGDSTTNHSDREMTAITGILNDKLDDLAEGSARSFNEILWRDGTQSSKVFAGVTSIVSMAPNSGFTGGVDRSGNTWWRNRAFVGSLSSTNNTGPKITASASAQTLSKKLRSEVRQLRRYGGKPSLLLAGSGFIEKLESEVAEKGTYTMQGFANKGATDIGLATIQMRGVGEFQYDPTLDDLGYSNMCFFMDPAHMYLDTMDGEDWKQHSPARPPEKYVLYRGLTWTGGLVADQLNCHGVYEAA